MLKKIESLRNRPKEVRKRYAFWIALSFTSVVVFFWLMSAPSRLAVLTEVSEIEKTQGGLSRTFSGVRESLTGSISDFRNATDEVTEDTVPEKDSDTIDISTFFSTSNDGIVDTLPQGRPILIGTTSKTQSTSTEG